MAAYEAQAGEYMVTIGKLLHKTGFRGYNIGDARTAVATEVASGSENGE